MSHIGSDYGQYRRTRLNEILSQEVPPHNKTAGETEYRPNATHGLGNALCGGSSLTSNHPQFSTPYDSIRCEEIFSEAPETLSNLAFISNVLGCLKPGPYTAQKSTVSNSGTLARPPGAVTGAYLERGRNGTSCGSKRGREAAGKSSGQQGPASKRTRRNRATSAVRSNNGKDAGGGGEDEEDEEDDDDDEESDEDDGSVMQYGPKEPQALLCPMPSCKGKDKLWDNWNNLIICERGCGRRFGLSSQYSRHVFKHKKKCKPSNSPLQRIPSLALDLNHAVSRVKGQNYEKLKQVIADHKNYDLEDPNCIVNHVESPTHNTSNQNFHQYNPQGQQLTGGIEQIIKLLKEHQRICQIHPQPGLPSSDPVQMGNQSNHSSSFTQNHHLPQSSIDPAISSRLNQPTIHQPSLYTQYPATAADFQPNFGNGPYHIQPPSYPHNLIPQFGQNTQGGGIGSSNNDYRNQIIGDDRALSYLAQTSGYVDNNTPTNRGASQSGVHYGQPTPTQRYRFNLDSTYGNENSDTTGFNRGS
ncbi:hypothetical protein L873DRAFT_829685 [Choiromyces venosus 120613-1]|uniref:C2H2-type domain-containing protein n=1 Tax=Choiromyces venosus 120613-1 TaxID=1336337 RepID=A0A3N4JPL7_9PEZI|nr:hypothetical protein L873DRAFT_829685 [Choiromyces venosus 120613-1]